MVIDITRAKQIIQNMKAGSKPWILESSVKEFLHDSHIGFLENYEIHGHKVSLYLLHYNVAIDLYYVDRHCAGCNEFLYPSYLHNKAIDFKNANTRLISIWDWEWKDMTKRMIFKNAILNACGKHSHTVYARNTYIDILPAIETKDFFNQNNIQGYRTAKVSICLRDKTTKEILMAYSLGHPYFGKGKYDLEIARGACKLFYSVPGGASKLWKFITTKYAPDKTIVYYVDLNLYNGNSLEKLITLSSGLQLVSHKPSFRNWFIDEQIMRNRDPQHHKEIKELIEQGKVLTCYNAGSLTYVYTPEVLTN